MPARRLLFVEDRPEQRLLFRATVEEWNLAHPDREFDVQLSDSVENAKAVLDRERFDCALFDLRLPRNGTGGESADGGNELISLGFHRYGVPVAVVSAMPGELAEGFAEAGIGVFDKGDLDAFSQALTWFAERWDMLEVLSAAREQMEKSGAEVFSERIWPRWASYRNLNNPDGELLKKIVTRQYASHVAELLGTEHPDNPSWHPFENYIYPSLIASRAHTGDIFEIDEKLWIVVTPQCDMATGSARTVLLVECERNGLADWDRHVAALTDANVSRAAGEQRDKFFRGLVNQSTPSKHFLPPLEGEGPLMVNFKELMVLDADTLRANLAQRRGSIAPVFLSNLIQRFGSFMSRPGQPNIEPAYFG